MERDNQVLDKLEKWIDEYLLEMENKHENNQSCYGFKMQWI